MRWRRRSRRAASTPSSAGTCSGRYATRPPRGAWHRLLRPGGRVVVIDGFWFDGPGNELFESYYDEATRRCLPGWQYFDTAPIGDLLGAAGFGEVTVRSLEEPSYAVSAVSQRRH